MGSTRTSSASIPRSPTKDPCLQKFGDLTSSHREVRPSHGSPNLPHPVHKVPVLTRVSTAVAMVLERFFHGLGWYIGLHPVLTIVLSITLAGSCGAGLYFFDNRGGDYTLWVPTDSAPVKYQVQSLLLPQDR